VRATVAVVRLDAVAPVSIDDAVRDQCLGVAATDPDPAPAPGRTAAEAIREDAQPLKMNGLVAVHPTEQCDTVTARADDGETSHSDVLRLLEAEGIAGVAIRVGARKDDAAERSRRIGLNHDAVALAQPARIVSAVDENLLDVCSGLDQDGLAGLHGVHRRLDGQMARRVTAAARIGGIDVPDGLLLHGTTVRRQNPLRTSNNFWIDLYSSSKRTRQAP